MIQQIATRNGKKPLVKCQNVALHLHDSGVYFATLNRTSEHPRLGPCIESATQTSMVLRVDFEAKWLETLNTVYDWSER